MGRLEKKHPGEIAAILEATLVPDVDLDVYIYIKQSTGTTVPSSLIGLPVDIQIESLSIWGVIDNNVYSIGGVLNFPDANQAAILYSQLPQHSHIWTKLVGSRLYIVQGSGLPTESLKNSINKNDFIFYNDRKALAQVAVLPFSCNIQPVVICIIKPRQASIEILKQYANAKTVNTIQSIFNWAKPKFIIIGLYSPGVIDLADLDRSINAKTISYTDLCLVASVNSIFPGFMVSPMAVKLLQNECFTKIICGNLTEYQTSINIGRGQSIPALLNVVGNRVFATVSGNEPYSQTLMNNINR
jgi:hypothetical protein